MMPNLEMQTQSTISLHRHRRREILYCPIFPKTGQIYIYIYIKTFLQINPYKDFFTNSYQLKLLKLMESLPTLKKCFDFVAGLSKKLLGPNTTPLLTQNAQNSPQKSHPNLHKPQPTSQKVISNQKQIQSIPPAQYKQKPKLVSFESYMMSKTDPLKAATLKCTPIQQKTPFSHLRQDRKFAHKKQTYKLNNSPIVGKMIENFADNKVKKVVKYEITENKITGKISPPYTKTKKQIRSSESDQLQELQAYEFGKKHRKIFKKNEKYVKTLEIAALNSDSIPFTYEDGDDISSIAEKSETTDQIQPQLLSFIDKRTTYVFNKYEEIKNTEVALANMKKKSIPQQGETMNLKQNKKSPVPNIKMLQLQKQEKEKPKKRVFLLYPGETIEQLKKRVLVQYSASQNSDSEDSYPVKLIKREKQEKFLKQLNKSESNSKMQEQEEKQFVIPKFQKMVDQSQNEESEGNLQNRYLDEMENNPVWDNNTQRRARFNHHHV